MSSSFNRSPGQSVHNRGKTAGGSAGRASASVPAVLVTDPEPLIGSGVPDAAVTPNTARAAAGGGGGAAAAAAASAAGLAGGAAAVDAGGEMRDARRGGWDEGAWWGGGEESQPEEGWQSKIPCRCFPSSCTLSSCQPRPFPSHPTARSSNSNSNSNCNHRICKCISTSSSSGKHSVTSHRMTNQASSRRSIEAWRAQTGHRTTCTSTATSSSN
ncbi:hypothetical protein CLOP_g14232 [Closterium sp. NIES-67]|nr:hypothetical protein CLOP_g14232 [Closterium sp. NIES-67]